MVDGEDWDKLESNRLESEGSPDGHVDISDLLDDGYEQLDGFVRWLETYLGVDTRTAQQDCFNAECLLDYLANQHRKAAKDVNEFEFRWFLFNHYIRRAMADEETETRLPVSVQRFFQYLEVEHGVSPPAWLHFVLDDAPFYYRRRRKYAELDAQDERKWQAGFKAWTAELEEDLDSRSLWLPRELGQGLTWGDVMGWREATLQEEANRTWQTERQELLDSGLDYDSVRQHLLQSYLVWTETPEDRFDEMTPIEVIVNERAEREEFEEERTDRDRLGPDDILEKATLHEDYREYGSPSDSADEMYESGADHEGVADDGTVDDGTVDSN